MFGIFGLAFNQKEKTMKRLKYFFISHQLQFFFLLTLFIILSFLSQLPYFNLILGKIFTLFIFWLAVIFLFKLSGRFSIKTGLIILCFCPFLLILKQENLAEEMGNLVYGLLLVGTIQEFAAYLKGHRILLR